MVIISKLVRIDISLTLSFHVKTRVIHSLSTAPTASKSSSNVSSYGDTQLYKPSVHGMLCSQCLIICIMLSTDGVPVGLRYRE